MGNRVLRCGFIGGVIVFVWLLISWMFLPWHYQSLKKFKDENRVYNVIRDNAPTSGIYILPNMYVYREGISQNDLNREMGSQTQMMSKGPVVFASVAVEGVTGPRYLPFVIALIIQIVGACIIAWMLFQTKFSSVEQKVTFVTLIGLLIGILGYLPDWNWWRFSLGYTVGCMADLLIGWCLAGFAMVKFSRK